MSEQESLGNPERTIESNSTEGELDCEYLAKQARAYELLLDAAKRVVYERRLYNVPPRQQEINAWRDLENAIMELEGWGV